MFNQLQSIQNKKIDKHRPKTFIWIYKVYLKDKNNKKNRSKNKDKDKFKYKKWLHQMKLSLNHLNFVAAKIGTNLWLFD